MIIVSSNVNPLHCRGELALHKTVALSVGPRAIPFLRLYRFEKASKIQAELLFTRFWPFNGDDEQESEAHVKKITRLAKQFTLSLQDREWVELFVTLIVSRLFRMYIYI